MNVESCSLCHTEMSVLANSDALQHHRVSLSSSVSSDLLKRSRQWCLDSTDRRCYACTNIVTWTAWVNEASRTFNILATLCELASRQVNESVQSFLTRTMATVDVLSEVEFGAQMNSTMAQLITSILIRFRLFMDTSQGLMHVDQPLNQLDTDQVIFNDRYTPSGMINRPAPEVSVYRISRRSNQCRILL